MADQKKAKNYIGGSAKMHIFQNGGSIINCFLKFEDLEKLPRTDKGYVRFDLAEMKEPDQYGNTHYAYENDWQPKDGGNQKKKASAPAKGGTPVDDSDDLPF